MTLVSLREPQLRLRKTRAVPLLTNIYATKICKTFCRDHVAFCIYLLHCSASLMLTGNFLKWQLGVRLAYIQVGGGADGTATTSSSLITSKSTPRWTGPANPMSSSWKSRSGRLPDLLLLSLCVRTNSGTLHQRAKTPHSEGVRAFFLCPHRARTSADIRKKTQQRHRRKAFLRVTVGGVALCATPPGKHPALRCAPGLSAEGKNRIRHSETVLSLQRETPHAPWGVALVQSKGLEPIRSPIGT